MIKPNDFFPIKVKNLYLNVLVSFKPLILVANAVPSALKRK